MTQFSLRVDQKSLINAIKKIADIKLVPKILTIAGKESIDDLRQVFIAAIKRTKVMKQLEGEISLSINENMRAHLGLTDSIAISATDEIESAIEDSINKFNVVVNNNKITYNISLANLSKNILKIPSAAYISTNSDGDETVIPWMEWLINGSETIDADILFITDFVYEESRSGDAVMVHEGNVKWGGWDIDNYHRFSTSENFIQEALDDEKFIIESIKVLIDSIKTVIKELR